MTELATITAPARITWWVYAGDERIRRQSSMRGTWGYDATCSCGWDSKTGGAVERHVMELVADHKRYDHERVDAPAIHCVICDTCGELHVATYHHEGSYGEGAVYEVTCTQDGLADYYLTERIISSRTTR